MNVSPSRRCIGCVVGLLFGLVGCDGDSGYRESRGRWAHDGVTVAPDDPATFRPIDDRFARDAHRGYYRGSAIADSEGATFEALSEHEARDRHTVWYCDTFRKGQEYWSIRHLRIDVVRDADPSTYRVLGRGHARDRNRVYADGVAFDVRDVATFEPLEFGFARDARRGYHDHVEIPDSDGATFEAIDAQLARDRSRVYFVQRQQREPNGAPRRSIRVLKDADVATLHAVGRGYAIDVRHVWYDGHVVRGADPSTFRIDESYVGDADAEDRGGPWSRGERLVAAARVTR